MKIPFIRPTPPRLSEASARLREIEDRGIFSNFGPVNNELEQKMLAAMFGGQGGCMTVCNATIGLMLAVQQAIGERPTRQRYALMPSFTFAATGHAAMWCGLTPLFCDIDPVTWTPCAADEDRLLAEYGDDIAVVMPYATFGYDLDLRRYDEMTRRHGVPVVVDAAASLGTVSSDGLGFGSGFGGTVVYSMHATKSFATGEAAIIYSADEDRIRQLRQMCNFGFSEPRSASMAGLNGKLTEVGALLGLLQLENYPQVVAHRTELVKQYRAALPELAFQPSRFHRQAHQFVAGLLPRAMAEKRAELIAALEARGIGSAAYFSPHLAQQDYFARHGVARKLPNTDDVSARMLSLPLFDAMTADQIREVTVAVRQEIARLSRPARRPRLKRRVRPVTMMPMPSRASSIDAVHPGNFQTF